MIVCVAIFLAGCPRGESPKPQATEETPRASVALRVLVVNEPGVAEVIRRLRGEWAERSGGEVSVTAHEWKDVAAAKSLDADVIIFPSRYLGELSARGWLQPVRTSVLEGDEFSGRDVYPLLRRELMRWGSEVMALPLGIQAAVPGKENAEHPGLGFLAVAAPDALANAREGALFDPQTMKPRIADQVYVDALVQFAKSKGGGRTEDSRNEHVVPVLGFADRMIAVSSASRNGASAFKLAAWLASPDVSAQLNVPENRLMTVRLSSDAALSQGKTEQPPGERDETTNTLASALAGNQCFLVPRISGVDEYMAALDEAAKSAPADQAAAEAALQKVAERWEQITNARGRDSQRRAYLNHLGISEK